MLRLQVQARTRAQVSADATLIFPLLVAATWGKAHWEAQE